MPILAGAAVLAAFAWAYLLAAHGGFWRTGQRLPGGLQPGRQVLFGRRGHAHGGGMDEDRGGGQVAGLFGGGHDERVSPVDRHIHVVQAQRLTDHPAAQVAGHGQRLPQHRVRIGGRVGPVVDRDAAEILPRGTELRQVTAGPGRVPG